VDIVGVNDGQPTITVAPILASELAFDGTAFLGSAKIQATDPDTAPSALTITVSISGTPAGTISPASLTYQQILNGSRFTYDHNGSFPIDLTDQLSVRISDGSFLSSPVAVPVNARVSFASNIVRVIDDPNEPNTRTQNSPYPTEDCASCHNSTGGGLGAPNFLNDNNVGVNYDRVRLRVTQPGETACTNANSPSSLLLINPTNLDPQGHGGLLRPGFNLGVGGNRNNYDLVRVWICSFNAANN
jgi:hypothetical protein